MPGPLFQPAGSAGLLPIIKVTRTVLRKAMFCGLWRVSAALPLLASRRLGKPFVDPCHPSSSHGGHSSSCRWFVIRFSKSSTVRIYSKMTGDDRFFKDLLSSAFWVPASALLSYEEPYFRLFETQTWWNNASITDTISYEDGSFARLILMTEGNDSIPLPSFGCGFVRAGGGGANYFFAVLLLGGANSSVVNQQVWIANREKPIRENGSLEFTADGGLVLRDSDGTDVWSTRTSGKSLVGIELGRDGNLQLYNNNYTFWQSFEEPSDALLPGQKLRKYAKLEAGASAYNWSSGGRFYVQMAPDGLTAFVRTDATMKYLQLTPAMKRRLRELEERILATTISYSSLKRGRSPVLPPPTTYAEHDGENLLITTGKTNDSYMISFESAAGSYQYLRLGFDGHLRTYRWRNNSKDFPEEVFDFVTQQLDYCQHPSACGDFGLCSRGGNCSCPKALVNGSDYFKQIEGPSTGLGCSENVTFSCQSPFDRHHQLLNLGNLSYFSFIHSQAADRDLRNLDACKMACLNNCTCRAAFFKYSGNVSDGDCYLLYKILSIRANPLPGADPYNSSAFIKVQLPYLAPGPPGDSNVPASSPLNTPRKKNNLAAIIFGSVAVGIVIFLVAICFAISKANKKKKKERDEAEDYFKHVLEMPQSFTYEELFAATGDFKDQLGSGGFGSVFKGELKDGTRIAVKRLDNRGQGMKEFLAEVETIGNVNHFNLVRLIGFCADKSCQLLAYEYMSNGSLDKWIFNSEKNKEINWHTRKRIILDIARGLAYLHEECRQRIVHLDIKPQNILLDDDVNAKVSDFGLSKLMARDQSQVHTAMRGTPGYLAPEWQQLRITLKVDVYSFGIVALEIICGRRNLDSSRSETSTHLLRLLQEKAEADQLIDIFHNSSMDIKLHEDDVLKMIKLAASCLQDDHTRRPQISMVVKVLEGATEIEPNISYRFCNAMTRSPTIAADSEPPQASVLSAPR
ncbi:hypothetical protein ACLOJK_010632 [Asimina triloba]